MNERVKTAIIQVRKHPDSAYIFCNQHGNPCIRKSFSTAVNKSAIIMAFGSNTSALRGLSAAVGKFLRSKNLGGK